MASQITCCEAVIFSFISIFIFKVQCDVTEVSDINYYNLTIRSRADWYVLQNQRQYAANVRALDCQLIQFKKDYKQRLETISYHNDLIEVKLNEVENKLNPLELLNDITDYCVQKYRSKLPNLVTITANLKKCLQEKGSRSYETLLSPPKATLIKLKIFYGNQFLKALSDCRKKFEHMEVNYTNCAVTAVNVATTYTNTNTLIFQNQMKTAACSASLRIKKTFDCYASIVFTTFHTIGEVEGLVDSCILGHESCPACKAKTAKSKEGCRYHLNWHLSPADLTSEKINNPFKGITKEASCLQVNFITNAAA